MDYAILEDMIDAHLLIEDLSPGQVLQTNMTVDPFTIQVHDPCGDRLLAPYGSDTGYSGYVMLYSILGDQSIIDTADTRNLKLLRSFICSLKVMTSNTALLGELDCVLSYMSGVGGCWNSCLPEMRGIWLGVDEIRHFECTEDIFIWIFDPGGRMHYISGERISLSRVNCLDCFDHVITYQRLFRKMIPPSQADIDVLLVDLSSQTLAFLKLHSPATKEIQSGEQKS